VKVFCRRRSELDGEAMNARPYHPAAAEGTDIQKAQAFHEAFRLMQTRIRGVDDAR
jgi:hypothetical protein